MSFGSISSIIRPLAGFWVIGLWIAGIGQNLHLKIELISCIFDKTTPSFFIVYARKIVPITSRLVRVKVGLLYLKYESKENCGGCRSVNYDWPFNYWGVYLLQ
jgi:hypothetical protein